MNSHLIIDTDIGTDVDDAVTLRQIIGSRPEYELSVTTVYGDVTTRSRIASNYCQLMNFKIGIYSGESKTVSGKDVWKSGLEGSLHDNLEDQVFESVSGVEHMTRSLLVEDCSVEILAIAPLTNVSHVIMKNDLTTSNFKKMYFMGGSFSTGRIEHNVVSDIQAAQQVLHSNMEIDIVGIEITSQLQISLKELSKLQELGPAGYLLYEECQQWAQFWNRDWIVPHDSIAYLLKSKPELFDFSDFGEIRVLDDGQTEFHSNPLGSKRIVKKMDIEGARSSIISSIESVKFL